MLEIWQNWLWFAGIALGLATCLSAVIYLLSELLQNDKMKSWAKMELTEVVYSAIIISIAIVGLPMIDGVVQGALGVSNAGGTTTGTPGCLGTVTSTWVPVADEGLFTTTIVYDCLDICGSNISSNEKSVYYGVESCHMRLGIWYMREIFDETKSFAFDTYMSYIGTSLLSEFTINIEFIFEKAGFFTFTPWRGFFTMGNKVKDMTFDWAIKLMMLTKFQEVLLRFIAVALFPALFIIGALLRTLVFTRRLGGLLLAMSLALYFVFPAFYSFGALVLLDLKHNPQIQDAWLHSPANPGYGSLVRGPDFFPDPPIANSMYFNGTITMPGGSTTGYNASEAREHLIAYEGMDSDTYFQYMEQGHDPTGAMLPLTDPSGRSVDLTSSQYQSTTPEQRMSALERVGQSVQNWFDAVTRYGMVDRFVFMAWLPNGPLETLARLTFWAVFFSLFSIIGTIAAIRSLSITFGGDIEIAGLTRLI